jgi:hypothetical protein
MTREQQQTLAAICRRFGCLFRAADYRVTTDGYVEGWCGGSAVSGLWIRVPPGG